MVAEASGVLEPITLFAVLRRSALHRRLNDAGESSVRFRTAEALRPVRKLAGNHGRTHGPLTPIVGRFDGRVLQESQDPTLIVLFTDSVQQPLVVLVLQRAMAQVVGAFLLELFSPSLEVLRLAGPLVTPKLAGVPQYFLQVQPEAAGGSFLGFQHFVDISLQMVQALLLVHVGQLIGIVAFSAVGYHHSRVVSGNHLPGLLAPCVSVERLGSLLGRGRD